MTVGYAILEDRGSMNTHKIIIEIDAQISRLQEVKALLNGTDTSIKRKPGRPSGAVSLAKTKKSLLVKSVAKPTAGRILSVEARAKIAAAQKVRWAKVRKTAKKESLSASLVLAEKPSTPAESVQKTALAKKRISTKKPPTVKKNGRQKAKTPSTTVA